MSVITELRTIRNEYGLSGNPEQVLALARPLIASGGIKNAGDESWDIYEQTLVAAAEASEDTLALTCLTRLSDKFPESGRVHALRGMLLEVTQDEQETLKFYNKVLDIEPTNVPIIKRRITYIKSLGKLEEAISLMVSYLDVYYTDAEAWAELADIYALLGQVDKATFCWSEVVLLMPHDHFMQASYADALLAQYLQESDVAVLHAALKTYLRSIELCDSFLRGFCGVKVCCRKFLTMKPSNGANRAHEKRGEVTPIEAGASIDLSNIKLLDLMSTKFLSASQRRSGSEDSTGVSKFVSELLATSEVTR